MSDRRLERAEELFHAARELPDSERAAFLARECGGERDLRELVDELLAADAMEHPIDRRLDVPGGAFEGDKLVGDALATPERIGRYRILRRLGEGGMGTVYEAEQEEPRRTVALKVLRAAVASKELARFRREAQVLGALQHPGIAQVYEAGTAPLVVGGSAVADVPFLALELVRGEPLRDAAERAQLDGRARLELVAAIGDAVGHAHALGIVHRDLKPANILVVEAPTHASGGRASFHGSSRASSHGGPRALGFAPKVLDFGIARLLEEDASSTLATHTGQVLGTLQYMSPEQARGETALVDARTDVWALGVILYELLAGARPFDLDGLTLPAALRRIEEHEPKKLGALDTRWRGDVETIVAKALEKDPARRYADANELAADLRRHLDHEPVVARPASAAYVLAKYGRRHRALVGAFAAGLVMLVGGLGYGLLRERAQRVQAQATAQFLFDMLAAPNSDTTERDITLFAALEQYAPELERRFAATPELELALRRGFFQAYVGLDRIDAAEGMAARALELATRVHGPRSLDVLRVRGELALARAQLGRFDEGAPQLEEVLALQRASLGARHAETCATLLRLASALRAQGRLPEELERLRELVALLDGGAELDAARELDARMNLGNALIDAGQLDEADPILQRALARSMERLGAENLVTARAQHSLSVLRSYQERLDEARALGEQALATAERLGGRGSKLVLGILANLGTLAHLSGDHENALLRLGAVAERTEETLGARALETLMTRHNLATALFRAGRKDEAEVMERAASTVGLEALGADAWQPWLFSLQHARFLAALERWEEAEPQLVRAHENLSRLLGAGDERALAAAGALAAELEKRGRADEAAAWAAKARPAR